MAYYTRPTTTFGASYGRSTTLIAPNAYDPGKTYPLVLILHSYGASGADIVPRLGFDEAHNFDDGVLILAPDGVNDGVTSNKWWDYTSTTADAFTYLKAIVDEVCAAWPVDTERVYIIGYSNGGFMAHRLVAAYQTRWTAIWTLAGSRITGETAISTAIPATIVHGDGDTTVLPDGDVTGATLPGSMGGTSYKSHTATAADYDSGAGGSGTLNANYGSIDLVTAVVGAETTRRQYDGLTDATNVEKWTIEGGDHSFSLSARRGETVYLHMETYHRGV
jgi:polyhydroxybutyrate depolymerase